MGIVYCNYSGIDSDFEQQFNEYWQQIHQGQTMLQHIFQNEKNNHAAVFNNWIRLLHHEETLVVKPDKLVLHAYDELLMKKINFYLGEKINYYFDRHHRDPYIIFLYAYTLTAEVIQQVNCFCKENSDSNVSRLILYPYFYLSDTDLTEDAEIYYIMKVLIADFLHGFLTQKVVKDMHIDVKTLVNEMIRANALI